MQGVGRDSQELREEWQTLLAQNDLVNVSEETKQGVEQLSGLQVERIKVESDIKAGQRRLDEIDRRLELKGKATGGGARGFIQPEDFKKLASEKLFAEIEQQGLIERRKTLDTSIAALEKRLRELPNVQVRLDQLNTQISSLDRGYTLLSDRYNEAQMSATEEHAEAKVLHAARVPEEPGLPIKVITWASRCLPPLGGGVYLLVLNVEILPPRAAGGRRGINIPGTAEARPRAASATPGRWLGVRRYDCDGARLAAPIWSTTCSAISRVGRRRRWRASA
jgi:hypothetical protein